MPAHRVPLIERFRSKVERDPDGCWRWVGSIRREGYGRIAADFPDRRSLAAHRVAYELFVGPIGAGLQIDHLCRNRWCVNPDHLEAVTPAENMRRGDLANGRGSAKTHCPHGHPYTPENTFLDKRNKRYCRTCQRTQTRDSRRRKRAAEVTPHNKEP